MKSLLSQQPQKKIIFANQSSHKWRLCKTCTSYPVTCDAPACDLIPFKQWRNILTTSQQETVLPSENHQSKIVSNSICCFFHSLRRYRWRIALLNKYNILIITDYMKNQTIGLRKLENKQLHALASSLYLFIHCTHLTWRLTSRTISTRPKLTLQHESKQTTSLN